MRQSFLLSVLTATSLFAGIQAQLIPSDPSPSIIGDIITWTAQASDSDGGKLWYRFRVRETAFEPASIGLGARDSRTKGRSQRHPRFPIGDGGFRMLRDFGPNPQILWNPLEHEGQYEFEVTVRNLETGSVQTVVEPYEMLPAVTGDQAVVTATNNSLVFVYSAPACAEGLSMRVTFATGSRPAQQTSAKDCDGQHSMNFYLAGLYADSTYKAQFQVLDASGAAVSQATGTPTDFTTGSLPATLAAYSVSKGSPSSAGVIVRSPLNTAIAATDLDGNVIWFYQYLTSFVSRVEPGGFFWTFFQDLDNPNRTAEDQLIRKFDLAGIPILETNAARVSEQLVARGERPITGFHHEVIGLPDGRIALIANSPVPGAEYGYDAGDVLGDKIVVLDPDLNVVWTWDAFEHLDPVNFPPILRETCATSGGCPAEYVGVPALDWMHSNSLSLTPDGNLLLSVRHLDWLLKIDYGSTGSGDVLWRLGKGGDFQLQGDGAGPGGDWPWFSHQHDASFLDENTVILFDNGNTRITRAGSETHSRGQIYRLDEGARTATLLKSFDVGAYSPALGSAQQLPGGNFHFNAGFLQPFRAYSVEVNPAGNIVYQIESSAPEYRAIRIPDLYSGNH